MALARLIFSLAFINPGLPFPNSCPDIATNLLIQSLHHQRPRAAYLSKKGRTWSLVICVETIRSLETLSYGDLIL